LYESLAIQNAKMGTKEILLDHRKKRTNPQEKQHPSHKAKNNKKPSHTPIKKEKRGFVIESKIKRPWYPPKKKQSSPA